MEGVCSESAYCDPENGEEKPEVNEAKFSLSAEAHLTSLCDLCA